MRRFTSTLSAACAAIVLTAVVALAQGLVADRSTYITFSAPVAIPGVTLPAGTYLFKLLDSQTTRNVVQIFDKDRTKIFATLIAIPAERNEPSDESAITFREAPANAPPACTLLVLRRREERAGVRLSEGAGHADLEHGSQQKKVLIVISDGGDNASASRFAEVLDLAMRTDTVVYTIGLFSDNDRDAKPKLLEQLAHATGAEAFFPRRARDVSKILEGIARDIRSGYTLGYSPRDSLQEGHYRSLRVEVRAPGRGKLSVRSRSGYVSGPKSGTDDGR